MRHLQRFIPASWCPFKYSFTDDPSTPSTCRCSGGLHFCCSYHFPIAAPDRKSRVRLITDFQSSIPCATGHGTRVEVSRMWFLVSAFRWARLHTLEYMDGCQVRVHRSAKGDTYVGYAM